jgi:hypothetical protein
MTKHPKPTIEQIRKTGQVEADTATGQAMAAVKATCKSVRDNGQTHARGETFAMEISVAAAHIAAGQVELVGAKTTKKGD